MNLLSYSQKRWVQLSCFKYNSEVISNTNQQARPNAAWIWQRLPPFVCSRASELVLLGGFKSRGSDVEANCDASKIHSDELDNSLTMALVTALVPIVSFLFSPQSSSDWSPEKPLLGVKTSCHSVTSIEDVDVTFYFIYLQSTFQHGALCLAGVLRNNTCGNEHKQNRQKCNCNCAQVVGFTHWRYYLSSRAKLEPVVYQWRNSRAFRILMEVMPIRIRCQERCWLSVFFIVCQSDKGKRPLPKHFRWITT